MKIVWIYAAAIACFDEKHNSHREGLSVGQRQTESTIFLPHVSKYFTGYQNRFFNEIIDGENTSFTQQKTRATSV